jgi:aspartate aminotransferase-like enzyme
MTSLLEQSQKWLSELGIRTEVAEPVLKVNRTDMMNAVAGTFESQYDEIMKALRETLKTNRLYWSSKDDDWLILDSW